jgi:cilia- and flagella-associated protein 57
LEKAKYVLSFRTTEIRKELEPKEEQVDKLKAEMFKLEEEYKEEKKRSNQLSSRLEKLERINEVAKR